MTTPLTTDSILRLSAVDPATRMAAVAARPAAERAGIIPTSLAADAVYGFVTDGAAQSHRTREAALQEQPATALLPERRALQLAGAALFDGERPNAAELSRVRRALLTLWASPPSTGASALPGMDTATLKTTLREIDTMAESAAVQEGYRAVHRAIAPTTANGDVRTDIEAFDQESATWLALTDKEGRFPTSRPKGMSEGQWKTTTDRLTQFKAGTERQARTELLRPSGVARQATSALFPAIEARADGVRELVRRRVDAGMRPDDAVREVVAPVVAGPDRVAQLDDADEDLQHYAHATTPGFAAHGAFEARLANLMDAVADGSTPPAAALSALATEVRRGGMLHEGHLYRLRQAESALRQAAWNRARSIPVQRRGPEAVAAVVAAAQDLPAGSTQMLAQTVNRQMVADLEMLPSLAPTGVATVTPVRNRPVTVR